MAKIQISLKRIAEVVLSEWWYVVISIIAGISLALLIPPFQVPDEEAHYYKISAMSTGEIFCEDGMYTVPSKAIGLVTAMNPNAIVFEYDSKFDPELIWKYRDTADGGAESVRSPLCETNPAAHAIPAAVTVIADILGVNPLVSFYAARIVNLLLAVALMVAAGRIFKEGRKVIYAIGLLPMTMFLFASLNYDAIFIPAVIMFIAYILNLIRENRKLTSTEVIVLAILSFFICTVKLAYAPMIFIAGAVLLFRKKLSTPLGLLIIVSLIGLGIGAALLLQMISPGEFLPEWADPGAQVSYLRNNPFEYVITILRTIKANVIFYPKSVVGVFGWLDYDLSVAGYISAIAGFAGASLLSGGKKMFTKSQRSVVLISIAATIVLILTGMYLFSTQPQFPVITGVQGRYFIPMLLPAALIIVDAFAVKIKISSQQRTYLSIITGLLLFYAVGELILQTVMRYYVIIS